MFCRNCGAQLQEGSIFCPMCGTNNAENAGAQNPGGETANAGSAPEGTAETNGNKAAKGAKKFGIAAAVVVVLIILAAVVSSAGSSSGLKIDKKAVTYVGNSYFMDADGNAKEVDELYNTYMSMDRSVTLYSDYSGDLYILGEDLKAERIASDVTTVYVGREGKYVVYLSNEDNDYYNQVLCIYDVSKKKSKEVDKDVYGDYLTISVSGETVAYAKNYDDGEFDTYVAGYSDSAKKIDSKSRRPVAVSNNGKKAYLLDSGDLYYYNGKESEKIEKDVSSSFWTNSDLSELVFTKNGNTYFCRPGKDAEKIDSASIYSIIYPESYGTGTLGSSTQALGNDTIKGQVVYNNDGKLLWVNKKASDMVKIDSNVYDVKMSEDGSAIVYISGNRIYRVSKFKESMDSELVYEDEDIYSLAVSDDLKKIYGYSYEDDTVYYIKGSNKAEKISEDVDSFAFNSKDGKLYFVSDEELYEAKTSSSSKKKVSVDGDAAAVSSTVNGVVAYTRDGSDYICYLINKKLVKVYEED